MVFPAKTFRGIDVRRTVLLAVYFAGLLVAWEAFVTLAKVPFYILPSPSSIAIQVAANASYLLLNSWVTLSETVLGFAVGAVVSIILALLTAYSRLLKQMLYPLMIAWSSIPKVALAPLFLLWFGIGLFSKVMMAFVISFFPILVTTLTGLEKVDPDMIDLIIAMNSTQRDVFLKIRLPHSVPYIFDGFKVAITLALVGAIVGEFISSASGLGMIIVSTSATNNTPLMFAALLFTTIWSLAIFGLIVLAERLIVRWQPRRG